ncbi:family 61 glycoside hydrolase [Truncatella angustata]|uniref:lytic cellulose monooxygenase (C4-dehydrogenating) n=1 Tax=Truncatella angustata TaxID=152316 RepID=A0A9P8UT94_9PEZI|nr:family 61 glycoside hydrolase [Truncatella angustata]KAH6657789.1 family 61 glycoside hydrolase [Truncatella angustata]
MPSLKAVVAATLGFASTALGHGYVTQFTTDGKSNQGFLLDYYYQKVNGGTLPSIAAWYAENLDSGFVAPSAYGTADINCHKNSAPGAITASVSAGGSLTFQWPSTWPHPYGPILTYVAACSGDCSTADKTKLSWVKIDAVGIDYTTQKWASQTLIDQGGKWTTKVPASLKAGNYVFRHEIIALHGAGSLNGAQNYPQCFNIAVTGSGTKSLPSGTLGTSLYKNTDPGIYFNPYVTITSYTMPGPTLWTG